MSRDRPIAYILGTFPQRSQTFIAREVRGLLAAGLPILVFSLRRRPADALEPSDREWYSRVRFAPRSLSPRVLAANFWWLRRDARAYFRAFLTIFSLPHRPRILRARTLPLFMIASWIARELEEAGGCRLVHAHFALAQTEVAMAAAGLMAVPYSFTAHARDIYGTPSALAEKVRNASLVVTCTAHNRSYLAQLCPDLPPGHIQLVYHGVDLARFSRLQIGNDGVPVFVSAGRFVEKKGFDVLIDACALLAAQGVAFRCVIAGAGPLQSPLSDAVRRAGLDDVVRLPGWLTQDELADALARATALVVPSRIADRGDRDGIPNVVLEAMAAGKPIVATRVSGIPEAVLDGATGLLIPPQNAPALAGAMHALITDGAQAHRLGEEGRRSALSLFDLEANSKQLAALFDDNGRAANE